LRDFNGIEISVPGYNHVPVRTMRWLSQLMLVLALGLLVALGFLVFRQGQFPTASQVFSGVAGRRGSSDPVSKPSEPKPEKSKPNHHGRGLTALAELPLPAIPGGSAAVYRFPMAQEVVAGAAKSAVLANFGQPTAIVSGAEHGELRERFVYLDKAAGLRTSVFFVDGKVAGAATYPE
jgi:hypothetical protein